MNETTMALIIATLGFLSTVLKIFYPLIKAKISDKQQEAVESAMELALFAAEQLAKTGKITDKKAYVIKYIQKKFPKMTTEDIETLLEGMGGLLEIFK